MNKQTRAALEASIRHWKDNVAAESWSNVGVESEDCPLCAQFNKDPEGCGGCPVKAATGEDYCVDTPWLDAANAYSRWTIGIGTRGVFRKTARDEVDFLKSILPKEG